VVKGMGTLGGREGIFWKNLGGLGNLLEGKYQLSKENILNFIEELDSS